MLTRRSQVRRFPAGEQVVLLLGRPTATPSIFPDPDRLDLSRPNARGHVGFGSGIHHCLGALLARLEGQEALRELFGRIPGSGAPGSLATATTVCSVVPSPCLFRSSPPPASGAQNTGESSRVRSSRPLATAVTSLRSVSGASALPLIDEHETAIEARALKTWEALLATLESSRRSPWRAAGARLLGCEVTSANQVPLRLPGATTPGFHVAEAISLCRLHLSGQHRFSQYALVFELETLSSAKTRLRARTHALFPGLAGGGYRRLVIGGGFHVAAVSSTLSAVKRRAEANAPANDQTSPETLARG